MSDTPTIEIILSTYNGSAYLQAQLDSLAAQTFKDWRILARDDGSTDDTVAILERFRAQHPEKLTIIQDQSGNMGAARSFAILLSHTKAAYICCADQDDVWMPDKLSSLLTVMHMLEQQKQQPLLIFHDMQIVDDSLQLLDASLMRARGFGANAPSLKHLLLQNTINGCALMLNRALLEEALPMPDEMRMHDMWLALVAAATGHIHYIDTPLVQYRQHAYNVLGAGKRKRGLADIRRIMQENSQQASALVNRLSDAPPYVRAMAGLFKHSWIKRRILLCQHRLFRKSFKETIGLWVAI